MPDQTAQENKNKKEEPERELVSWQAPARPFKRRNRDFYVTVIAIAAVFGLILFLVEGVLPVILIVSIVFLFYVLSTVEPEKIDYQITTKGIKVAGRLTDWRLMNRFWFTRRFDSNLLVVETATFPGRLEVVIDETKKEEIEKSCTKYLTHEEVSPSSLDKAANWVGKKFVK
jgi:hypothetical protein